MAAPQAGQVPREALAFIERKKLRIGFDYRDVWKEEHAQQFTVAKITQADVLADVKSSLEEALKRGESFDTWRKRIKPELEKAGWWEKREVVDPDTGNVRETEIGNPHRLRTIYETNMRSARAAGQWQRIQRTKRALPYLLYLLGPSVHHREEHVQWHGVLLPVDHEFWRTHMPQNGWGCKCHVRQVGPAEYRRLVRDGLSSPSIVEDPKTRELVTVQELRNGLPTGRLRMERRQVKTKAPPVRTRQWVNKRTGEIERVPVGIDPGFSYNPGAEYRLAEGFRTLRRKLPALPDDLAQPLMKSWVEGPAAADWLRRPVESMPVAWLPQVASKGLEASNRVVWLSADTMAKQRRQHPELTAEEYLLLPWLLSDGLIIQQAALRIAFFRRGARLYKAVVKATGNRSENYVVSFIRTDDGEVRRDRRRGQVLQEW